jgi:hypothetical protein
MEVIHHLSEALLWLLLVEDVPGLQILLAVAQAVALVVEAEAPVVLVVLQLQIKVSQVEPQIIIVLQIQSQLVAAAVRALQVETVLSLAMFWEVRAEMEKVLT